MKKEYITKSSQETQKLGGMLAKELKGGPASTQGGEIIALTGELGSGKTTFTQGFLKGLGAIGPYTSPTFLIMKQYHIICSLKHVTDIYHFDAYRVGSKDILELGWEEIIANDKNVIIIEWADRIKDIVPANATWVNFEWVNENKRKIIFKT